MSFTKDELTIALVQMTSNENIEANKKFILEIFAQLESQQKKIDLVCFPENSLFFRVNDKVPVASIDLQDHFFTELAAFAKKLECHIHLGSFAVKLDGAIYNSTYWVLPNGEQKAGYQKIHLFDIALEGQKAIEESAIFAHGKGPVIQNVFGWKIGESICYDIRFAELYNFYAKNAVDLILIPAAFLATTGQAHWETLVRARAIESQAFVLASCQSGEHKNADGQVRFTFGHSMLVDPWGQELINMQKQIGVKIYNIAKANIQRVRKQIPMHKHRRL